MAPDELGMDESIPESTPDQNFNENPDEGIPSAPRRETVKPIFPNKKMESPNAQLNRELHKKKLQAQRKYKNKQARLARRKNRK
jgi:hypothetical protein